MNARLGPRGRMVPVCWRCQCPGVHGTDDQCLAALRVRAGVRLSMTKRKATTR
jgi:hypothetical protein